MRRRFAVLALFGSLGLVASPSNATCDRNIKVCGTANSDGSISGVNFVYGGGTASASASFRNGDSSQQICNALASSVNSFGQYGPFGCMASESSGCWLLYAYDSGCTADLSGMSTCCNIVITITIEGV